MTARPATESEAVGGAGFVSEISTDWYVDRSNRSSDEKVMAEILNRENLPQQLRRPAAAETTAVEVAAAASLQMGRASP